MIWIYLVIAEGSSMENYTDFIRVAEGDSNNANQINMLEWKGNLVDEGVLGNQGGNN